MIGNDAQILQHFVENWTKVIPKFVSKLEDKIISRKVLPVRTVGADIAFDIVQEYDRTGNGAEIVSKGTPPKGSGSEAEDVPFKIYQILDGFDIHEKDLKLDPKLKERNLNILLKNIHRRENIVSLQGSTSHNIGGIVPAAQANTNGVIADSDIAGSWDGSGTNRDIYNDLLLGNNKLDPERDARWLIGNKKDLNWLFAKDDDNRAPFWKSVCTLFGKFPTDPLDSWMVTCGDLTLPQGQVYIACHDDEAGELIISENPTLRALSQQRGGNYPIEMYEWMTVEIHDNDGFVQVATVED